MFSLATRRFAPPGEQLLLAGLLLVSFEGLSVDLWRVEDLDLDLDLDLTDRFDMMDCDRDLLDMFGLLEDIDLDASRKLLQSNASCSCCSARL